MARNDLFRGDALKNLRDPEQLDTALRLTSPKGWLALVILGAIIAAAVVWAFVGRLPFSAEGFGIVLYENSAIYDVVANGSGIVGKMLVKTGDKVTANQRIAVIMQPDQKAQIDAAQNVYDSLQKQYAGLQTASASDVAERKANTDKQVSTLKAKIAADQQQLAFLQSLYEDQKADLAKNYVTRDQVDQTLTNIHATQQSVRDSENQIAAAQTAQVEFENTQRSNLLDFERQVLEAKNNLDNLKISTDVSRDVTAPIDGTVVGVATKTGAFVDAGQQVASIEQDGGKIHLVAYFPVQQGKKIQVGMSAQVSPTTVERDIYGSINGEVSFVGSFPETSESLLDKLGNQALVDQMMAGGAPIAVHISLKTDPNAPSGLDWSSSFGPPIQITPGTTAAADVTIQENSPISLLLPIIRTWVVPTEPAKE